MAKSQRTVAHLLAGVLLKGESVAAWCDRTGFPRRTLLRAMAGGTLRLGTKVLLAPLLRTDVPGLDAAIKASRAAAN